ncbi:MAG: SLBB domain-containing protein [Chloroflexi bacterium]|nr:SLBB domain-containing protein [Chloroflexota bacterium]
MSGPPAATDTLGGIKVAAQRRLEDARKGKTRFTVQVGHCSQSVGATQIALSIAEALPPNSYLTIAGCDGACHNAPQVVVTDSMGGQRLYVGVTTENFRDVFEESKGLVPGDSPFLKNQHRVVLQGCGDLEATDVDEYLAGGGYEGLASALSGSPEEVIEEVKASGLRGRGGAYFPVALKWQGARAIDTGPRYLVVNCEEGEPGLFKDRHIMEGLPHRLLEGAIIAAYAAGTGEAYFYINAEAKLSASRMETAVEQAYEQGLLGKDILGSGFDLEVKIMMGAGGYVCGEETTLLNTMEGDRREPRLRPPFPTEAGLWARPTVINNAETLSSVPYIMQNGAAAFAEVGTEADKGTKIMSLSGSVRYPGLAEVPMGTTLRQIIFDIGGGPAEGHELTAIAVGGPSSGIFPTSMLDTPIKPGFLHESGVMLGAGGIIALDERVGILETVRRLAAYNSDESCGKCTPCREGTPRMVELLDKLAEGKATANDINDMRQLAEVVNAASLCGLGQAAGNPILSALHFFGDELAMMAK